MKTLPPPPFQWEQACRNAFETHFEILYKNPESGCKKWVRVNRCQTSGAPGASSEQLFGPNDEGPFKSETDLLQFLPHLTFPAECHVCAHKMQFVVPVGVAQVACTKCHAIIEVPKTFKEN